MAYYLKDDLKQIWEQPGKFAARMMLLDWYHQALASGVRILQDFARTECGGCEPVRHAPPRNSPHRVDGRCCCGDEFTIGPSGLSVGAKTAVQRSEPFRPLASHGTP